MPTSMGSDIATAFHFALVAGGYVPAETVRKIDENAPSTFSGSLVASIADAPVALGFVFKLLTFFNLLKYT